MVSEEMMLPTELDARVRYICDKRTIHGSMQAKCWFLHEGQEYSGILWAPDNGEWLADIPEGTILKARNIGPCQDQRYKGEYKGTALPLEQQSLQICNKTEPPKEDQPLLIIDMADMPNVLREAASMIEMLLAIVNKSAEKQAFLSVKQKPVNPPFRSSNQWADEIAKIIGANRNFQIKPFSAISLNAYIETCFDDFWEGDLYVVKNGARWRLQVSAALKKLVDSRFIERVPGTQKHYQVTQDTLTELF